MIQLTAPFEDLGERRLVTLLLFLNASLLDRVEVCESILLGNLFALSSLSLVLLEPLPEKL